MLGYSELQRQEDIQSQIMCAMLNLHDRIRNLEDYISKKENDAPTGTTESWEQVYNVDCVRTAHILLRELKTVCGDVAPVTGNPASVDWEIYG